MIFPFVGLKARPAGSDGEMLQLVAGEPVFRGAIAEEATPEVRAYDVGECEIFGRVGITARFKTVVSEPALLVAVTVYAVNDEILVGVPNTTPF